MGIRHPPTHPPVLSMPICLHKWWSACVFCVGDDDDDDDDDANEMMCHDWHDDQKTKKMKKQTFCHGRIWTLGQLHGGTIPIDYPPQKLT